MNTKLLKQKILDLAIRGKLTQQLKSDGNTADLLKEISSACHPERSAKGAKSKDFKQIIPLDKSEAPFEIPENWEWVRLGDLMSKVGAGSTPTGGRNVYESSGVKFIRSQNVYNEGLHLEDVVYINESIHKQKQNSKVVGNDLLLNITGASIGRCAIVPNDFDEANINQHVLILRLLNFDLLKYIHLAITSRFVFRQIMGAQVGGTKEGLSAERAKELQIPLPPLAEQQRIVAKIEEAFAEIDAIEKNKELLKTHIKQTRQKILDLAIHGKLVPQNKSDEPASVLLERITRDNPHYEKIGVDNVPFEIPEKWCWCRLGDVLNIARGGSPRPIQDYLTNEKDGLNWIKIGDAEKGGKYIETVKEKIKPSGLSHTRAVKAGDFLLTNSMSFGRPYILKVDGCIHDGWLVLGNVEKSMIPDFLYFMLSSDFIYQSFAFAAAGSTVKNLKSETVQGTLFPLPPLAEQSRIVAKIEELFSTLDQMERNLV